MPTFTGTAAGETIIGSDSDDVIRGLGGGDIIYGRGGNDVIDPGAGASTTYGGDGDDILLVEGYGMANAVFFGEAGLDTLDGSQGPSQLRIGIDYDSGQLTVSSGSYTYLSRVDGVERFIGGSFDDTMNFTGVQTGVEVFGGDGKDSITGGSGIDVLRGGAGSDTLTLQAGDTGYGDEGNDTLFIYANPGVQAVLNGGVGSDTARLGNYAAGGLIDLRTGTVEGTNLSLIGIENLDLYYVANASQPITVICSDAGSTVSMSTEPRSGVSQVPVLTLLGGAGADTLTGYDVRGGDGDDVLLGNLMSGGAGNDRLTVRSTTTVVDGGAGNDTVIYEGFDQLTVDLGAGTLTAGSGSSRLALTLTSIENFVGGSYADILRGSDQANWIEGGAGNDRIEGGAGDDILYGDLSGDIHSSQSGDDNLFGQEGNDTLYGGDRNDMLDGGVGDDFLDGGDGNDILIGGDGADRLLGGSGDDTLGGGAGDDVLNGGAGIDVLDGGDGRDEAVINGTYSSAQVSYENNAIILTFANGRTTLRNVETVRFQDYVASVGADGRLVVPTDIFGSNGADRITGTANPDRIIAGDGDDFLIGDASGDILDGGAGIDTAGYYSLVRSYGVAHGSASFTSVGGGVEGGTDSLTSIERLSFLDGALDLNPNGAAAQIYRLYDAALDRAPDQAGLSGWVGRLGAGTTLDQAAQAFATAPEFVARYGNLNNEDFVKTMYRFSLNREGDAFGISQWKAQLDSGVGRGSVLLSFSESVEHRTLTSAAVSAGLFVQDDQTIAVARLYDAAFDRVPDVGGIAYWRGTLNSGGSLFAIANAFVSSQEFQDRYGALNNSQFIDQLYRFTLDREADAFGRQVWIDRLNAGTTRAEMVVIFSESVEHVNLTAPSWAGGVRYEGYVGTTSSSGFATDIHHDAFLLSAVPENSAAIDHTPQAEWSEGIVFANDEVQQVVVPVLHPDAISQVELAFDDLSAGHRHHDWM